MGCLRVDILCVKNSKTLYLSGKKDVFNMQV